MMPHNKNGRPNREHRRGAGQIPFESQVRTSHNSRVLERDKLCIPWFVRVLVLLQQQMVDIFFLDQKYFPYRSPHERILRDPFLIGILLSNTKRGEQDIPLYTKLWVASKPVSRSSTYPIYPNFSGVSLMPASAFKPTSRTPFSAPTRSLFANLCQWKLMVFLVAVSFMPDGSKYYFYPYQVELLMF